MTGAGWGVGQIRMGVALLGALYLPGITGNYVSTPDSVANSISGDIDMRISLAADDWTPSGLGQVLLAKVSSGGDFAWQFMINPGGQLRFIIAFAVGGFDSVVSTSATGFTDATDHWVRVTQRQSDGRYQFFTSVDGSSWTQLGTDIIGSIGFSNYDGAGPVTIGARGDGSLPLAGMVHYAEVRAGIGGTVIHSFDAAAVTRLGAQNPSTVAAGGPWTINGGGWDWV